MHPYIVQYLQKTIIIFIQDVLCMFYILLIAEQIVIIYSLGLKAFIFELMRLFFSPLLQHIQVFNQVNNILTNLLHD